MVTDNVLIEESLLKVIDYNWKDELRDFQETYEVEISSQDDLDTWIRICEQKGWTTHIFYNLMVLKSRFQE